jgi:hypothetical protein
MSSESASVISSALVVQQKSPEIVSGKGVIFFNSWLEMHIEEEGEDVGAASENRVHVPSGGIRTIVAAKSRAISPSDDLASVFVQPAQLQACIR